MESVLPWLVDDALWSLSVMGVVLSPLAAVAASGVVVVRRVSVRRSRRAADGPPQPG
jgi:hypothetical protein